MIRNLNLVVAEEAATGKIVVLHVSNDRAKALTEFEKAAENKKFECVVQLRNPAFSRRKFPSRAAEVKKERLAAKAAEEAAAAEEDQPEQEQEPVEISGAQ